MLLFELVDPQWETSRLRTQLNSVPNAPMSKAVTAAQSQSNHKYVGSGSGAYVGRTDNPHELDNVERLSDNTDGTSLFYQWLLDHPDSASNPYFPRVKSHQSKDGISYSIIERLVPLQNDRLMSEMLMKSVWERMFNLPLPTAEPLQIVTVIADKLELACSRRGADVRQTIVDPHLIEAINLLMTDARMGSPDIHENNLMWRITGNRPQLVFTDPFI